LPLQTATPPFVLELFFPTLFGVAQFWVVKEKQLSLDLTLSNPEQIMADDELLTCAEVMRLTSIRSRTTVWRRIQQKAFPAPVDIGAGRIRWRSSDVAAWIGALPLRRY